jgi:hypothetical protein
VAEFVLDVRGGSVAEGCSDVHSGSFLLHGGVLIADGLQRRV